MHAVRSRLLAPDQVFFGACLLVCLSVCQSVLSATCVHVATAVQAAADRGAGPAFVARGNRMEALSMVVLAAVECYGCVVVMVVVLEGRWGSHQHVCVKVCVAPAVTCC